MATRHHRSAASGRIALAFLALGIAALLGACGKNTEIVLTPSPSLPPPTIPTECRAPLEKSLEAFPKLRVPEETGDVVGLGEIAGTWLDARRASDVNEDVFRRCACWIIDQHGTASQRERYRPACVAPKTQKPVS